VQVLLLGRFEKLDRELVLRQGLAASDRDPPTRSSVERSILFDLCQDFGDAHFPTDELERIVRACLGTAAADITARAIDDQLALVIQTGSLLQAGRHAWSPTRLGANASGRDESELG
jgi:hypothetical protein